MGVNKFEKLNAFKESHALVLQVYKQTKKFPKSEHFALTSQLRRSASSIAANIVEGNARNHKKEYVQFIFLAISSLEETKYHLLLAKDLGYISNVEYTKLQEQAEVTGRLLSGLRKYIINHKS